LDYKRGDIELPNAQRRNLRRYCWSSHLFPLSIATTARKAYCLMRFHGGDGEVTGLFTPSGDSNIQWWKGDNPKGLVSVGMMEDCVLTAQLLLSSNWEPVIREDSEVAECYFNPTTGVLRYSVQ